MPSYRLVFPPPEGVASARAPTAHIESDRFYEVGDEIEHGGRRWRVAEAPIDDPTPGATADLMVWPVD